jgi:hypothetical protein
MAKPLFLFPPLTIILSFLLVAGSPAIAQLSEVELPVKKIPHPAFRDTLVDKWNKLCIAFGRREGVPLLGQPRPSKPRFLL